MKRLTLIVLAACWIAGFMPAYAHGQDTHKADKQYEKEHKARLHRHRTKNAAERNVRMKKYAKEHKARIHRHRARIKARKKH